MTKSKGIKRPDWNWTAAHDELLRSKYQDTTKKQLAILIGCTPAQVLARGQKLGLKTPNGVTRIGIKKSDEALEKLKFSMRRASEEGRIKPPTRKAIEAGLAALKNPEVIAKRAVAAGNTMRGIPQRMDGLTAKAEHNKAAKTWTVINAEGDVYTFTNLSHFVRENQWLFNPKDVEWKGPENNPWCRAQRGLYQLFKTKSPNKSWKGWTAIKKVTPVKYPVVLR